VEDTVKAESSKAKFTSKKLAPKRPIPTVARSVNASGPKSSHHEGENLICITRKTPLARYLQRCKGILTGGKHKYLLLYALGAAIPHLMLLATSLPLILPFPRDEVHIDSRTDTVDCTEELVPEDEEEDISYRTKGRSAISVLVRIGDEPIPASFSSTLSNKPKGKKRKRPGKGKQAANATGDDDSGADDLGSPIHEVHDGEDSDEDVGVYVYEEGSQEE